MEVRFRLNSYSISALPFSATECEIILLPSSVRRTDEEIQIGQNPKTTPLHHAAFHATSEEFNWTGLPNYTTIPCCVSCYI